MSTKQCDNELAKEFGYDDIDEEIGAVDKQVHTNGQVVQNELIEVSRLNEIKLGYIRPVPTQMLTVFLDEANANPVHIDIDSGATINFIRHKEAIEYKLHILPNGQLSTLGDGRTKLPSVGEIDTKFFRNNWNVRFRAVVVRDLQAPLIGGTVFMVDNFMEQDLNRRLLHIHNRKITVQETDPISLLPIKPLLQFTDDDSKVSSVITEMEEKKAMVQTEKPNKEKNSKPNKFGSVLHCFKSDKVILPGQSINLQVVGDDQDVIAVEPWEQNKNYKWPEPQLCSVLNGSVQVFNTSDSPIILNKDVKYVKTRSTTQVPDQSDENFYFPRSPNLNSMNNCQSTNLEEIKFGEEIDTAIKNVILEAHDRYQEVFNKDLSEGYNDYYGRHRCELNWASNERPLATKVKVPNYNHDLQGLQQELMDDLTDQNVLLVPQEHHIIVQAVCPSFLQRKQRAKDKPQHMLTKDDVRLLINFGPVNDLIKPIPSHTAKPDDVLIKLGRWNEVIVFDLYNGYFQIKMSEKSIPWLGVQTPFGGLRVIARSGQGLLGQGEEFDEILAKVLKEELREGICTKIVDDLYVGGDTQEKAANNYIKILTKLKNANLKIAPNKTHIFPASVDVLGWVWKKGGFLAPSPHRQCALTNVKQEDIRQIRDMRSWIGLYKTLHIATPNITAMLGPFETATAGKDTKEEFPWTHELTQLFRQAKNHVQNMKTLYLPSPDDQLMMFPDGSKMTPGIGHILYAVKDGERLPVRFHNFKLSDNCRKWSPCEIEALAFAAGIEKEFDLLRESKNPIIICPDSKPVHDAVNLINKGKFSTSARMTSFLANVNRIPIISKHVSGKAKLNPFADLQSRAPSECDAELCTIHRFVDEAIHGVINPGAKNSYITDIDPYSSRAAWKKAQDDNPACGYAKNLMSTGKPPPRAVGKTAGDYFNEARFYCREATLSKDGLLVVKTTPDARSGNLSRDRIIVPKLLVPALLYHLHNHLELHPTKNQQKLAFQRRFHAMDLEKHLDHLYNNCYKCQILQKFPVQIIQHETKNEVDGPHKHFHADVIKRSKQIILTVKDHFSSLQDAMIINSEKAEDLKTGIILLTSTMRKPDVIHITIDNAPGFISLIKNKDRDLEKLKIVLLATDEFNKNANAVVDKGCQELEEELLRLDPEGTRVSQATLTQAILSLNRKLRRRGNISAYELHTARDLNNGSNLRLDDQNLRNDQVKKRKSENAKTKETAVEEINVGDTVLVHNRKEKHKARDIFIVTAKKDDKIKVQKVLHPFSEGSGKFMSKVYTTDQKRLKTIHRPSAVDDDAINYKDDEVERGNRQLQEKVKQNNSDWNPVNKRFYQDEDSDDEEKDDPATLNQNPAILENNLDQNEMVGNLFEEISMDDEEVNWDENDMIGNLFEDINTGEGNSNNEESDESEIHTENTLSTDESRDGDIEDNNEDAMDADGGDIDEAENDLIIDQARNPTNLPIPGNRIIFWDPQMRCRLHATVTMMTKSQQTRWPGWRNVQVDNNQAESSVNMDRVSLNCVGWRFLDNFPQIDGNYTEGNVTRSTPPTPNASGAESANTLDWDNYVSDPTYISPVVQLDWTARDRRRSSRERVKIRLESDKDNPCDYVLRPRRLSFYDVDALDVSSNASWYGEVFEMRHDDKQNDVPPPLPPRAARSQSVIVCSTQTCKPRASCSASWISHMVGETEKLVEKYNPPK